MKKFLILAPEGVEFEVVKIAGEQNSIIVMEAPSTISHIALSVEQKPAEVKVQQEDVPQYDEQLDETEDDVPAEEHDLI